MDKPDNINQEDWQDLLRNPNDFLKPNEIYMIMGMVIVRQSLIKEEDNDKLKEFDLIIAKLRKSFEECSKPEWEPREHHIEIEDGKYTTDVWLTVYELHLIDYYLSKISLLRIQEPEYVKWQKIRTKILTEILKRFK